MGRGSCCVAPAPVFPGSLSFFPSRPRAPKRRLPARLSRSRQRSVTRLHDPLREGPETLVDFLNLAAKYPGTYPLVGFTRSRYTRWLSERIVEIRQWPSFFSPISGSTPPERPSHGLCENLDHRPRYAPRGGAGLHAQRCRRPVASRRARAPRLAPPSPVRSGSAGEFPCRARDRLSMGRQGIGRLPQAATEFAEHGTAERIVSRLCGLHGVWGVRRRGRPARRERARDKARHDVRRAAPLKMSSPAHLGLAGVARDRSRTFD